MHPIIAPQPKIKGNKKSLSVMKGLILLVPGTGLEPVRLLRSQDFKHFGYPAKSCKTQHFDTKLDKIEQNRA